MQYKITHLTSAHPRDDIRIFHKLCSSLANVQNYDVSLVVADGIGDERKNNISIIDVGKESDGRFSRMTKTVKRVFEKAKELDSDLYHFHDPELIPIGLKLKRYGKKVIFDAHEDFPKQLLGKPYLNKITRLLMSKGFELYEKYSCVKFDAIMTATPCIKNKFLKINKNSIDINNYPILGELANSGNWGIKQNEVSFVGWIAKIRGIEQIISALEFTNGIRLNLAGAFTNQTEEKAAKSIQAWSYVNELGFLDRKQISELLAKSCAGIVTYLPLPNHVDSQPNKMFEYMSAGIPIITSNFPLWKEIVEGSQCGICVDPLNSKLIGEAIQYIIDNPIEAEKMGKNGRKAVEQKYNWEIEESKLLDFYKELLQ
jgi:glycosyltransferase involved in cell wall biosynthesis